MKLSEMTNDQVTNAMLRLSGPIASICDDDEMTALMDDIQAMQNGGVSVLKATATIIPKFVTLGFRKHKKDLYEIVGALTEKTNAEVGQMNFIETINAVKESYDEVLASFFTRSGSAEKKNEAE